ncbi:MAG TPA: hypothetical protein VH138_04425 [Vicinamibacterales bacterium]|nr:hypothetical protein [Vicinamibacterales bacterium]
MRNITKAIAIAAMLAFPVASFAQTAPAPAAKQTAAKADKSAKKVATHTTKGTVKSSSDSQLVITTGSGKAAKDETFAVNASTTKTGTIETGAHVSVHYTTEGSTMTATAITASAPKAAKSSKKK